MIGNDQGEIYMITQEEMNFLVRDKLREIEESYDVDVLWAVESGSRAWGFASPDSDFDVRFIYRRRKDEYLRLDTVRDVIELPVDDTWDLSGWDLDKALRLLQKSNPSLYEWFGSPIVYRKTGFEERIKPLLDGCFSEGKMLYHYLSTARNDIKSYLQTDAVKPKKYFYALRPVLACRWVMKYKTAPPVLFSKLCDSLLPKDLKPSVDRLVELKMNAPEDTFIPPVKDIDDYLAKETDDIRRYLEGLRDIHASSWKELNGFFAEEISRPWKETEQDESGIIQQDDPSYSRERIERMERANAQIPKEIIDEIDSSIEREFENETYMGICHEMWVRKKKLCREKGYVWYSPSDIYPGVIFD